MPTNLYTNNGNDYNFMGSSLLQEYNVGKQSNVNVNTNLNTNVNTNTNTNMNMKNSYIN